MRQDEGVFEIPRRVAGHIVKLSLGLVLTGLPLPLLQGIPDLWPFAVLFVLSGLLLVAVNVHPILRRPPLLRATRAGLWFGGGAIISWRMVTAMYDAALSNHRDSAGTPELRIVFRDRTVLRDLPPRLWFATALLCRITIRLTTVDMVPVCVLSSLEAMRARADSDAASSVGPPAALPVARAIVRSQPRT